MSARPIPAIVAAVAAAFGGCGAPQPRPVLAAAPPAASAVQAVPEPAPPALAEGAAVPLATVIELARRAAPTRALAAAERAAAAAAVVQAGAWANPALELGIGRARARDADDAGRRAVTAIGSIGLSQRFELPGRRSSRLAAAEAGRALAERGATVAALEAELEVRAAAVAVAVAELQDAQAGRAAALAADVHAAARNRQRAGESDRGDPARAAVELATAQLAQATAALDADAARAALRAWCGAALPVRFTVADALPEQPEAFALAELQAAARARHPRAALVEARVAAAAAATRREQRAWYPELTLGVAASRESDSDQVGLALGLELPLWDRNRGGVAAARAELARAEAEARQALARSDRQVLAAWSAYERERQRIAGLAAAVLPAAQDALRVRLAAYAAGDGGLLELLDVRRGVLDAEQALLEARGRAALARLELAGAVGAFALPIPATPSIPTTMSPAATGAQP